MANLKVHVRHHFGSDPAALQKGIEALVRVSDRARAVADCDQALTPSLISENFHRTSTTRSVVRGAL